MTDAEINAFLSKTQDSIVTEESASLLSVLSNRNDKFKKEALVHLGERIVHVSYCELKKVGH